MFQYASGKALALKLEVAHLCDASCYHPDLGRGYGLGDFRITSQVTFKPITRRLMSRRSLTYWKYKVSMTPVAVLEDPIWSVMPDFFTTRRGVVVLRGYWAWRAYFETIRPVIATEFRLQPALEAELAQWRDASEMNESVALHIRRGDYVSGPQHFGVQTIDYYRDAMRLLRNRLADPVFHVFSDDLHWVAEHWLPALSEIGRCVLVRSPPGASAALELKKISACEHQIIANSTFSWWAAWLNPRPGKIVVQPKRWYANPEWQQVYEEQGINTDAGWLKV